MRQTTLSESQTGRISGLFSCLGQPEQTKGWFDRHRHLVDDLLDLRVIGELLAGQEFVPSRFGLPIQTRLNFVLQIPLFDDLFVESKKISTLIRSSDG